ncbi:hypothetical protein EIP91_005081 [Steccherinum ochraceum]|uniref:FAD-binding domain-containing protein n=1 Tax=Steccherinum ochraceum TaxID=92696 RepID=A0A4R0R7R6_9APHY|nr:hypothetical protein EIP91_005081 [Steccherinum ochraceum]
MALPEERPPPALNMPTINYQAALTLDIVVVGGGISGLATAFVLQRAGHRVHVLEELQSLGTPAAGLRVPPNLSKIFREWIGEEELSRISVRNIGTPWYDLESGQQVGYHHWTPAVMKETGGDFLMMHHEDVHKMLYRLATDVGVKVQMGCKVEGVRVEGTPAPTEDDPEHIDYKRPRVVLANNVEIETDLVVGADGPTSIVRETIFADALEEAEVKPSGLTVLGGIIPADEMLKDPDLGKFVLADEWPIFMGPNRSMCCHPVRAKKEFSLQLYWPDADGGPNNVGLESWYEVIPTDSIDFTPYAPSVQRLMKMVPFLTRTRRMIRPELEDWTDDSGQVVLIGEAAHPWLTPISC